MSNPFATFRKNQTYWMAALVLVAILAFIIAPAIEMVTRSFRTGGSDNSLIATWNGGQMTKKELEETLRSRVGLRNFLNALAKKVVTAGGQPAVPGFMNFGGQFFIQGVNDWQSEADLCYSKIMLTMAEKVGVEFDDSAADEFLKQFCNKKVADSDFNELLTKSGLTIFEVRQMIKQDLITSTTAELLAGGTNSPAPDKLWKNFLKLNQKVKIEAYPVLVSSFMDKVGKKPTDSQLQEIYDSGKARASHPDLAEPGFVKLDQAKVEYVQPNLNTIFEREKAKITEEEIKAEYEKQKTAGLLKVPVDYKAPAPATPPSDTPPTITPPGEGAAPSTPATPPATTPEKPAAETPATPATTEPAPTTPPTATPEPATPPTTPATPPAATPEPTAPAEPTSPTAPPADNPNPAPPAGDAPATPGGTSMNLRAKNDSEVRLVSFVQEATPAQEPAGSTEPAPATPAPDTAETPTAPSQETTPAPATTTPAPATTAPATAEVTTLGSQEPAPATTPAATTPATTTPPAGQDSTLAVAEPTKPATRDMTYEEAREILLTSVGRQRTNDAIVPVVGVLQDLMQDYTVQYRKYEAIKNSTLNNSELTSTKVEKPQRPNLKKFAEEHGFTYGETDFVDQIALAVTDLGQSRLEQGEIVANQVTRSNFELFTVSVAQFSFDGSRPFYFWKTDSKPAALPQLSEIRDLVEDWWKRIEARKLAEEAALAMQKKVGAGEDPWAGLVSENERSLVITSDQFTWVSRFGAQLKVTAVPNLERIGEEFMKKVFNTEVGKFGVVANNPKTVYYVYRVLEKSPDVSELQTQFNSDPLRLQASRQLANSEGGLIDWQARLVQELGVQFQ